MTAARRWGVRYHVFVDDSCIEGVVRTSSNGACRLRFTTPKTEQRLASENAYSEGQSIVSSSHRLKRCTDSFHVAAQDAESQLRLGAMGFRQLAKHDCAFACVV